MDRYMPGPATGDVQGENVGSLPDKGCSTGFIAGTHGVSFDVGATQSMGSIAADTGSDGSFARTNQKEQAQTLGTNSPMDSFTGSLGTFDGGSDAPNEENVNDADAGQPD